LIYSFLSLNISFLYIKSNSIPTVAKEHIPCGKTKSPDPEFAHNEIGHALSIKLH
jgi:hypothetical protein